jgi:hypothetical protein
MKTFDKIFFGLIFGAVLPVTLFLAGWWGTFRIVPENRIFIFAFSGFAIGLIIDLFFIKKVISNLYNLKISNLILIYIFYTVCMFGFFMGVPVFNVLLGIPSGYYIAKRCISKGLEKTESEKYFKQTALFTMVIIFFVSVSSASIALIDPYTSQGIKGMTGMNFEITKTMLVTGIITGGILLVLFQYYLTKFTAKIIYSKLNN